MTSRELIRWSRLHERRARKLPVLVIPVVLGGLLAAWVAWRSGAGSAAASHAWLAGAIVVYAVAFLRVPFHIYWRADAPLLAQLPIEGGPLFDAALLRCLGAAAATTLAVVIGAVPLVVEPDGVDLAIRHAVFAATLGIAAGLLLPAVTVGAASLVVHGRGDRALRAATALGGAPTRAAAPAGSPPSSSPSASSPSASSPPASSPPASSPPASSPPSSSPPSSSPPSSSPAAILGALPGFAATIVITSALVVSPWLIGSATSVPAPIMLAAIAAVSVLGGLAARAGARIMAIVLRDVSALDRQRLATLEIKPPTPIEGVIGRLIGEAALPYDKDARLMRRRFPMAFALGALGFAVLVIVGLARPDDPTPWLTATIGGAAAYGLALAGRLHRPPVELARLSATLPLTVSARARAKLAWLLGWWTLFIAAPAVFAALRQSDPVFGLAVTAATTIIIIVAGASPR